MSQSTSVRRDEATDELRWTRANAGAARAQGWFFYLSTLKSAYVGTIYLDNDGYSWKFKTNIEARAFFDEQLKKGDPLCTKAMRIMLMRRLTS